MNGNRTVQAPSPDVGSAPASLGQISLAGQSEVLKQVLCVIEKKVRNMEKKKVNTITFNADLLLYIWVNGVLFHLTVPRLQGKLDDYQAKKNKGERLNQDQLVSRRYFC